MRLEIERPGDVTVLKISGRMDAQNARFFEEECQRLLDAGEKSLIGDLGNLQFISSAGLKSLLTLSKKVAEAGGKFLLYNLGGAVKEVFEFSGLSEWILRGGQWVRKE
jgi:anti-anti-sigma factor